MNFHPSNYSSKTDLGNISNNNSRYQGSLYRREQSHLLKFKLSNRSSHNFQLKNIEEDVNLKLLNRRGRVLGVSKQPGSNNESISETLEKGTYYLKVCLGDNKSSSYTLVASSVESQENRQAVASSVPGDGITREEMKLYKLINRHRADYGQPKIPLSKALSTVANRHVIDLSENFGFASHSWSDALYSSQTPEAVWEAPQRLGTGYPGNGYENILGTRGYTATAKGAFKVWKASDGHNDTMLSRDNWEGMKWKAIGVGIYKGFAAVWFGEQTDPTGKPSVEK